MAAAVANYGTPQPIVETLNYERERVNRYVWYAGEDLPWPEIKGGFIRRCRVTAIVPFPIWERISDVTEDLRLRVRKEWMDKAYTEAEYEIQPSAIFDSVESQYGHLGLRELTTLKGMTERQVWELNIDATFFPWTGDEIPKPYRRIEEKIHMVLGYQGDDPILRAVGEEMLASIKASREYDQMFVDRTENQKEPVYSHPVFRAMSRLERRRRDAALTDMASADLAAKKAVAQGSGDNSAVVAELVEQNRLMREELAMNREAMAKLLTDRPKRTRQRRTAPAHAE